MLAVGTRRRGRERAAARVSSRRGDPPAAISSAALKNQGGADTRRIRAMGTQPAGLRSGRAVPCAAHRRGLSPSAPIKPSSDAGQASAPITSSWPPSSPTSPATTVPAAERFYRLLKERAQALPDVRSVALTSSVPMDQHQSSRASPSRPRDSTLPAGTENVARAIGARRRRVLRHARHPARARQSIPRWRR